MTSPGGTPEENAAITRSILSGEEKGPKRQAVCLNAGAAFYITGKTETMADGIRLAEKLIDEGAAMKKLEEVCRGEQPMNILEEIAAKTHRADSERKGSDSSFHPPLRCGEKAGRSPRISL